MILLVLYLNIYWEAQKASAHSSQTRRGCPRRQTTDKLRHNLSHKKAPTEDSSERMTRKVQLDGYKMMKSNNGLIHGNSCSSAYTRDNKWQEAPESQITSH